MSPFQKFDHKLIFVILIRYINTKSCSKAAQKTKSCSKLPNLEKVAPNAKSCSKVAEHNLSGPTYISMTPIVVFSYSVYKINVPISVCRFYFPFCYVLSPPADQQYLKMLQVQLRWSHRVVGITPGESLWLLLLQNNQTS